MPATAPQRARESRPAPTLVSINLLCAGGALGTQTVRRRETHRRQRRVPGRIATASGLAFRPMLNSDAVRAGDEMWYQAGVDLVVVVHLLFIGFVVGGVFLAWRWPRVIWAHVPAVIYGALVEFAGFTCP